MFLGIDADNCYAEEEQDVPGEKSHLAGGGLGVVKVGWRFRKGCSWCC